MFYTIYKITNNLNGKHYIGKHKTNNLDDGYMGSGKLIRRAIEKYGIENFSKEILFVYTTEEEMNAMEKELVTLNEDSYNLCPGGKGGWGYVNKEIWTGEKRIEHNRKYSGLKQFTFEQKQKISKLGNEAFRSKIVQMTPEQRQEHFATFTGKKHSEDTKTRMSEKAKGRVPWNKGRPRTEEEKQKIRDGIKRKLS